ncbi:hypothetical protein [Mesorhizobium sp. M2A.F.Ca.ET.039.01.1.1]|uniref:hypothetical protein n=1 Tax=Mesorhizobium sp. M2A.F.Ca.ET.039.01.1.1 TaxID=2496746 RepID=UPI000FCC5407|nr:hypothetical protein [Mesorhizobium sp. M2A.F.Ca.ET.039.01.1.1]RWX65350.1 hypothetical protein EOA24_20940 [Mesorhizobium sp. M2A.F.Ca.ET.039.01.1.1]
MIRKKTVQLRQFIGSYVRDQARAGVLPIPFQGAVRAITAFPSAANTRVRPIGIVLGVERLLWQGVEQAYPEWNLLFASNRADPDGCVNEIIRLGATAIIGPAARRRHVVALRDSGINILRLSPAPLPRLTHQGRLAHGYVLEPSTSWMSARRLSEMEVILKNGSGFMTPAMRADAAVVASRIALPDPTNSTTLVICTSDTSRFPEQGPVTDLTPLETGGLIETFEASRNSYWSDDSLDRFDAALGRASAVMTNNHPLAVAALLRGVRPLVSRSLFLSKLNLYSNPSVEQRISVEDPPLVSREELVAVCVLWAARYICEGNLIDPVDFFREKQAS